MCLPTFAFVYLVYRTVKGNCRELWSGLGSARTQRGRTGEGTVVRWAELFRDLEGQADALASAELAGEVAERTRLELARIRLVDRLRAGEGRELGLTVLGAGALRGTVLDCGPDWLLVAEDGGREALVPLAAVLGVVGLDPRVAAEPGSEGAVSARCGLGVALRALARDRAAVGCTVLDGSTVGGTVERVGADHLELAVHPPGERRTRGAAQVLRLIPFGALSVVRRS